MAGHRGRRYIARRMCTRETVCWLECTTSETCASLRLLLECLGILLGTEWTVLVHDVMSRDACALAGWCVYGDGTGLTGHDLTTELQTGRP